MSLPLGGLAFFGLVLTGITGGAVASPGGGQGTVVVPDSAVEAPDDIGKRAHSFLRSWHLAKPLGAPLPSAVGAPPYSGYFFETPASIACVYNLVTTIVAGCNPNLTSTVPNGGFGAIALVDAYDDPTVGADLAIFSSQFGLAPANFRVIFAAGRRPRYNEGWALEEALDVEWAHAMAPGATIYLVEAADSSTSSLLAAVTKAGQLVAAKGGGEVSMSWGGSEYSGETSNDTFFTTPGVVYVAAAGDSTGVSYPSASPDVVAAGGTTIDRNPTTGSVIGQGAWQATGGGPSAYEPRPGYQDPVATLIGARRATPDLAFDADPATGVWVYSSARKMASAPWHIVGGTSVAAPALAGIINAAGGAANSSGTELTEIYANAQNSAAFTPIRIGNCGPYGGYVTEFGSPFCAGIGAPFGLTDK